MRFALEWRDRRIGSMQTPRRFLDYIVDGESLYEQHGVDFIGALGWGGAETDEEAARRLLLEEDPDVDNRVAVYICPEDGDLLCGAVTAVIQRVGDEVVWRDLALSSYDFLEEKWHHDSTGFSQWSELRFPATDYAEAIANRPRSARQ